MPATLSVVPKADVTDSADHRDITFAAIRKGMWKNVQTDASAREEAERNAEMVLCAEVPHFAMAMCMAYTSSKTQVDAPMQSGKTSLIIAYCLAMVVVRRICPVVVVRNLNDDRTQFAGRWKSMARHLLANPIFSRAMDVLDIELESDAFLVDSGEKGNVVNAAFSNPLAPLVAMANPSQLSPIREAIEKKRLGGRRLDYGLVVDEADLFVPVLRADDGYKSKKSDDELGPLFEFCSSSMRVSATQIFSTSLLDKDANRYLLMSPEKMHLHGNSYRNWAQVTVVPMDRFGTNSWPNAKQYAPELDAASWDFLMCRGAVGVMADGEETQEGVPVRAFLDELDRVMLVNAGPYVENHYETARWLLARFGRPGLYVIVHNEKEITVLTTDARGECVDVKLPPMRETDEHGVRGKTTTRTAGQVMKCLEDMNGVFESGEQMESVRSLVIIAGNKAGRGTSYSSDGGRLHLTDYVNVTGDRNLDWDRLVQCFGRLPGRKPNDMPLVLWATSPVIGFFIDFNRFRDDFGPKVKKMALADGHSVLHDDESGCLFEFTPSLHLRETMDVQGLINMAGNSSAAKRVKKHVNLLTVDGRGRMKDAPINEMQMLAYAEKSKLPVKDVVMEINVTPHGMKRRRGEVSWKTMKLHVDVAARRVPLKRAVEDEGELPTLRECTTWARGTRSSGGYGAARGKSLYHDMVQELVMAFREICEDRYEATGNELFRRAATHRFGDSEFPSAEDILHESFSRVGAHKDAAYDPDAVFRFRFCTHRDITKMGTVGYYKHGVLKPAAPLNYKGKHMFTSLLMKEGRQPLRVKDIRRVNEHDDFRLLVGVNLRPDDKTELYLSSINEDGEKVTVPFRSSAKDPKEAMKEAKAAAEGMKENGAQGVEIREGFVPGYICATASGTYKVHPKNTVAEIEEEDESDAIPAPRKKKPRSLASTNLSCKR